LKLRVFLSVSLLRQCRYEALNPALAARPEKIIKKSIFTPAAANRPTPPRNYADGCDGLQVPNEGEQETKKK
jgi:hypothetical protein